MTKINSQPKEPRNELLPRVSKLIEFLNQEEFDAIPPAILQAAAERGTAKHELIEKNYGKPTENPLVRMFAEGLQKIFTEDELQGEPVFEEQLNGKRFTGKPDVRLGKAIIDNKFSIELRPTTALQDVLYAILELELNNVKIDTHFAFHFPKDHGLFIHKIPDAALAPLHEYANYILDNHEAIEGGDLERYDAIIKWQTLLQDHDVFEPVAEILPPRMITNDEEAFAAVVRFYHIKAVTDYEKKLKREIKRYMDEQGATRIEDPSGYGVRLQGRKSKLYDDTKKAAAKAIYDKALSECQTGTHESLSLVRFKPTAKKVKTVK